jgi:hypothetical protein
MKDSKTSYVEEDGCLDTFVMQLGPSFLAKLPRRKRSHAKFLREKEYYSHAFPQRIDLTSPRTKSKEVATCLGHGEPTPTITPCRMDGIWIRKQFFIVFLSHS